MGGGRYSTVKPHPPKVKRELFIFVRQLRLKHTHTHKKKKSPTLHTDNQSDNGVKQQLKKANEAKKPAIRTVTPACIN